MGKKRSAFDLMCILHTVISEEQEKKLEHQLASIPADAVHQTRQLRHFLWLAAKLLKKEWSCEEKSCKRCEEESCEGRTFMRIGKEYKYDDRP